MGNQSSWVAVRWVSLTTAACSPDGTRILMASRDKTAKQVGTRVAQIYAIFRCPEHEPNLASRSGDPGESCERRPSRAASQEGQFSISFDICYRSKETYTTYALWRSTLFCF